MDESERAGGVTPSENGNGARPRGGRSLRRAGWAAEDAAAWSQAGALSEPGVGPTPPGWQAADPGDPSGWAEPPSRYAALRAPMAGEPPVGESPASGSSAPASASGPPLSGPPLSGPPLSGPPLSGPPLSGPPLSGPPLSASSPPVSGSAPPAGAPIASDAPVSVPAGLAQRDPSVPDPSARGGPAAMAGRAAASVAAAHGGWRPERPRIPSARSAPAQERDRPVPEHSEHPPSQPGLDDVTPAEGLPQVQQPRWEGRSAPPAARAPQRYAEAPSRDHPGAPAPEWSDSAQQRHIEPPAGYPDAPSSGYAVPPGFRPQQRSTERYATDPDAGDSGYPSDQPGYPPDQSGYPSDQSGYPPDQPGYPPDQSGYPSDQPPYAPAESARPRTAPPRGSAPSPAVSDGGLEGALPQRVPSEPDVPTVPEPPAAEPPAEAPELARIATHLRRYDVASPQQRQEPPPALDVAAIMAAVRGVSGVRDASLRTNPGGGHTLRLDLADDADPAQISRQVTRLLQERMGLAAAPQGDAGPLGQPRRVSGQPPVPRPAQQPRTQTRRWQPPATARGRAGTYRAGGGAVHPEQVEPAEEAPRPGPLNLDGRPGIRVMIDQVQVGTFGLDANVEVRLLAGDQRAVGLAGGPATEAYIVRLCAAAAASAIDQLLRDADPDGGRGRCFLEHATVVPLGGCEVAVAVVLLMCGEGGWVEQLAGSAVVAGDPRQAIVRATLAAVNRRLEALLA